VNAHGFVDSITCNGKKYSGNKPWNRNQFKSPIRAITTSSPYKDVNGAGMTCGNGAQRGAVIASCTAGSPIIIDWEGTETEDWPHEYGALLTYMAKVPAGQTADKVDPRNLDFFKVQQEGQEAGQKSGWFLQRIKNGAKYSVQIPKALESGQYIMRHEIMATHLADKKGGAEFYTSCFQLNVNNGAGNPKTKASQTARFPGAYKATDPGIFAPGIFNPGYKWKAPGPEIAKFTNSGSAAGIANTNVTEPATTSKTTSTKPTAKPTGKPLCRRRWASRRAELAAAAPIS
ncbi:hypothetical protein FRC12_015262, partial [Ceratobasidium sp. 428]